MRGARPGRLAGAVGVAAAATVVAACGGGPVPPTPPPVTADPLRLILSLDDMPDPGFATVTAPHHVDRGKAPSAGAAGLSAAAAAHYFRTVADLATATGPVDVEVAVERFDTPDHARAALAADARGHDAESGATPFSTGPLGDAAHADQRVVTDADGVQAVQFTVVWAERNVVGEVVVRGRLGGTGLGDALLIAHRQDDLVTGVTVHATAGARPSGSPGPTR